FLQAQRAQGTLTDTEQQPGIGFQVLAVRRNHTLQAAFPFTLHTVSKAAFQHLDHGLYRHRSTRRGTQQSRQGAIFAGYQFGTEFQLATALGVFLDDLYPLASFGQRPVGILAVREVVPQRGDAVGVRLHHFTNQVLGQIHIVDTDRHHRNQVADAHRLQQVQLGTGFQELGGKPGIRTEQQGRLTIDDAGIQVWYRHRWRTNGGFTIYLGVMLADDALVFAHQPLTGYRETAVTVGFVNTRRLQQRQGAAAGTEEHEAGIDGLLVAAVA